MMFTKKVLSFLLVSLVFLSITVNPVIARSSPVDATCDGGQGINTALGCLPTDINGFVQKILPILFGIAGSVAFLMMVAGFIAVATSGGDEKKLQGAKERITSALIGLLVSIFALFILRLIAIDILHIPGINS